MSFNNNNTDNNIENTGRRQGDAFSGSADPFTSGGTTAGSTDSTFGSARDDNFRGTGDSHSGHGYVPLADVNLSGNEQRRFMNTDVPSNTTDASTFGTGGDFAYAGYDAGSGTGSGARHDRDRDDDTRTGPGVGDKLRGNLEQAAGKVTRNVDMQEKGQERKTGRF